MSMQDPNRPARQRPGQSAPPPRPATPIIAVVIAAVAGILGLIVLKNVKDDGGASSFGDDTTDVTDTTDFTDDTTFTTDPIVETTLPAYVRTGAKVIVANGSGKKGAAGALTDELTARGYDLGKAFTANSGTLLDATQILVNPGDAAALAVAKSLIAEMGLTGVPGNLDESAPVKQSDVGDATVLILLGLDKAGQTLPPLSGEDITATTEVPIEASAELTS